MPATNLIGLTPGELSNLLALGQITQADYNQERTRQAKLVSGGRGGSAGVIYPPNETLIQNALWTALQTAQKNYNNQLQFIQSIAPTRITNPSRWIAENAKLKGLKILLDVAQQAVNNKVVPIIKGAPVNYTPGQTPTGSPSLLGLDPKILMMAAGGILILFLILKRKKK